MSEDKPYCDSCNRQHYICPVCFVKLVKRDRTLSEYDCPKCKRLLVVVTQYYEIQ